MTVRVERRAALLSIVGAFDTDDDETLKAKRSQNFRSAHVTIIYICTRPWHRHPAATGVPRRWCWRSSWLHTTTMYSFHLGRWTALSSLFFFYLSFFSSNVRASATPAASVAASYSLTTSTAFPFPTATLDVKDTNSFISSGWSLSKGRVQNGANLSEFVADPFPNSPVPVNGDSSTSSGPVFQVTYPAGSFNNDTGGAQFIALWNSTTPFQSLMVSYEIAFDAGFNFVKGGKLPGIRGGPSLTGCSGGKEADGTTCFSSRVMWRTEGEAEGAC